MVQTPLAATATRCVKNATQSPRRPRVAEVDTAGAPAAGVVVGRSQLGGPRRCGFAVVSDHLPSVTTRRGSRIYAPLADAAPDPRKVSAIVACGLRPPRENLADLRLRQAALLAGTTSALNDDEAYD